MKVYHSKSHSKYLIKLHLDVPPTVSPFEIAHKIKQVSTYRINLKYGDYLKNYFYKESTFWTDGYFVCSTGEASSETIRKYIENQG